MLTINVNAKFKSNFMWEESAEANIQLTLFEETGESLEMAFLMGA